MLATAMNGSSTPPEGGRSPADGVADALRLAVERTMRATAGSAASSRERAADLVDDVVRRSREAREQLSRAGQEAGAELARRGQGATGEVGKRIEALERRLAELEGRLETESPPEVEPDPTRGAQPKRRAEG